MNERQTVDEIIELEQLWSNGSVMAYHVTPTFNVRLIEQNGINPEYSTGKLKASWYVAKHGILWAIAHCSARHGIPTGELSVATVMLPRNAIKRSAFPKMFYVYDMYRIATFSPATHFITLQEGNDV